MSETLIEMKDLTSDENRIPWSNSSEGTAKLVVDELQNSTVDLNKTSARLKPTDFDYLKMVGRGGYGTVYQIRKQVGSDKGTVYAMKVIKKSDVSKKSISIVHVHDELRALKALRSPFFCELHHAFHTKQFLFIVMGFINGGDFFSFLNRKIALTEDAAMFYLAEIVIALQHLHHLDIVYRDLKPDNVMIDKFGHVKLVDFGLSKFSLPVGQRTQTHCGTMEYMAWEILCGKPYDRSVDIWSLGIFLYDMLHGYPPFSGADKEAIREKIRTSKPGLNMTLTKGSRNLIRSLVRMEPEMRLSIEGIKNHKFFETVNWSQIEARGYEPPFVPILVDPEDTSHFDKRFTKEEVKNEFFEEMIVDSQVDDENDLFSWFEYKAAE